MTEHVDQAPMTAALSDSERTRRFYDAYGPQETERLVRNVRGRVAFEVHRRFLARFIEPSWRVLEVGAGPGRFTSELAGLGARITVTDLSAVQLALNAERIGPTAAEQAVEARELLDVCDTSRYPDGAFDAVVAFGGPLSYAFEREAEALRGLLRIVRPGGVVVASVMSTLGTWRAFLHGVVDLVETLGSDVNDRILRTGDLRGIPGQTHECRMFRWREVAALVHSCGGQVLAGSASNWASLAPEATVARLEADPGWWADFLDHEVATCAEPGALDGGTHILFAARPALGHHAGRK